MNNRFTRKIKDRLNQNEWSWWHLLGIFLICLLNVTAQFSLLTKPYLSIPLMLFNAIVFTGIIKHSIDSGEDTAKFDIKNMLKGGINLAWFSGNFYYNNFANEQTFNKFNTRKPNGLRKSFTFKASWK